MSRTLQTSSFLMLEAVSRSFKKGMVVDGDSDQKSFPVDLKTIEIYYIILSKAHIISIE